MISTVQNLENMFNRAQIGAAEIPPQVEVGIPPSFALFSTHSGPKKHESVEQIFCQIEIMTYSNDAVGLVVDLMIRSVSTSRSPPSNYIPGNLI